METGVLVFKTGVKLKHSIRIPEGVRCVLNSRNHQTAELLSKMKISAAACGMSSRDTLSIASLDYGSAVLSLQRSVLTLQGKLLEPHDFQVQVEGLSLIHIWTVKAYKAQTHSEIEVIFNVFKELDYSIYRELLQTN